MYREVIVWNLRASNGCGSKMFPWFSSALPGKFRHSSIGTKLILSKPLKIKHPCNICCLLPAVCHTVGFFRPSSQQTNKQTPWSESASELHRPSERCLSAKWLSTFADRGCHVVSVTDPYGSILAFLDRSRYFSIRYSRGWVDPVPDPLHFFLVVPGIEPGPPDL
jgi:hypothetical protein